MTVLPETRAVCDALGLDPYGLLASGALLAAVAPEATAAALAPLGAAGIPAQVVGRLTPRAGRAVAGGRGRGARALARVRPRRAGALPGDRARVTPATA